MSSCSSSSWELDAMPPMDGVMPSSSSAEQGADQISESASSSSGERNRGRHLHVGRGNPGSLIKSKKRRSSNGGHQPEYIVGMGAQGGEQGQGVEAGTSFPGEVNRVEDANRPSGRAMKRPLGEDQGSRSRSRRRQSPEDDVEKARGHENSTDDPANHVGRLLGGSTPHGHMHEFAGQTAGADTITRRRCWNDAREEGMIAHARHSSSLDPAAPSSEVGMMYNLSTVKKGNVAPDFCSMFALTDSRWAPAKYEILSEGDDEHDLSTVKGCMSLMKHASGIYITVLFHMVITVGVLVSFRLAEKVTERRIFRNIVDETVVNLVTGIVAFALVFRINLAYARWWDSRRSCEDFAAKFFIASNLAFCFDQFTAASYRSKNTFRLRLASLYSLLHAEALKELGSMVELPCLGSRMLNQKQVQMSLGGPAGAFDANGRLPRGLQGRYSSDTIAHNVPATRNGVAQCYIWVVMLTSGRFSGAHHLSPPVIARLYSLLDEGIASYFDALVVRTTPFPYPFMQIINFGLFLIKIIVPVVVHQTGVALVWAIPLTCCCVFGFFGIGRVAEELEQPFGSDFYDHPLENWQIDFDLCLLDLVENQSFEVPRVDLPPLLTRDILHLESDEAGPSPAAEDVKQKDWAAAVVADLSDSYRQERERIMPGSSAGGRGSGFEASRNGSAQEAAAAQNKAAGPSPVVPRAQTTGAAQPPATAAAPQPVVTGVGSPNTTTSTNTTAEKLRAQQAANGRANLTTTAAPQPAQRHVVPQHTASVVPAPAPETRMLTRENVNRESGGNNARVQPFMGDVGGVPAWQAHMDFAFAAPEETIPDTASE